MDSSTRPDHPLASAYGVELDYIDNWGQTRRAKPAVIQAILDSVGASPAARASREQASWTSLLPPLLVLSPRAKGIELSIPLARIDERLEFACGSATDSLRLSDLPELATNSVNGRTYSRRLCPLPRQLAPGEYEFRARFSGDSVWSTSRLILAPDRIWWPEGLEQRQWRRSGITIALYGLRSDRNWGVGDFRDLADFGLWARRALGAELVGLNPLHVIPNRYPYNISPYLPTSAYFRNPLYLDVEGVPEFRLCQAAQDLWASPIVQQQLAALRDTEFVEYEPVWKLKLQFLRLLHRTFESTAPDSRRAAFQTWFDHPDQARLRAFSTFCALDEVIHDRNPDVWLWTDWPAEYREPANPAVVEFAREHPGLIRFHAYLQWLVDEQLAHVQTQLRDAGMEIGLYHDLALATDRFGFDVWYEPDAYVAGCRVGSPPDGFSPDGQDWSFPPPRTDYWERTNYAGFRELIRSNARHGGALRIDHVMRFYRLYWIPEGFPAQDGAYVRYPAETLLRFIALESQQGGFLVIGEDLGTVPGDLRTLLTQYGVLGYRLLIFEKDGDEFRPPGAYPDLAVASVTTHDLPTLFGFLSGRDIEARRSAGLVDAAAAEQQTTARASDQAAWNRALNLTNIPPDAEQLVVAAVTFLSRTECALLILNQEEITGEENQQNLPGSTSEYPNWRRKMKFCIGELDTNPAVRARVAKLNEVLQQAGRV